MTRYTVEGGTLTVPAGATVRLSAAQHADRRHRVEVIGKPDRDGSVRVRANAPLHFKAGERIELHSEPDRTMEQRLKPIVDGAALARQARAKAPLGFKAGEELEKAEDFPLYDPRQDPTLADATTDVAQAAARLE